MDGSIRYRTLMVYGVAGVVALGCHPAMVPQARGQEARGPLRAGAATSNITPWLGTSINGHFTDRKAAHVHDELHARALVLDDGRVRVALVAVDSCMVPREVVDDAKRLAEARTGIPAGHMLICATHTHTAATATCVFQSDPDPAYQAFLSRRIADGIARAANNLAPARLGWGSGHKPDHLFNRRWRMKEGTIPPNPFGESVDRVQMNPPRQSADLIEPAGPTDPELGVFSVMDADSRPLALVANYGLHYIGEAGPDHISADYFGMFADRVQALLGADRQDPPFVGMMTNGASGDVNNINFRLPAPSRKPYAQMRAVADDLAAEAVRVVRGMRHADRVALAVEHAEIGLAVRLPGAQDIERARVILAAAEGKPLTRRDEVYANETVKLAEYPSQVEVPLQVIRIGDAAIAAVPCEIFAEVGLTIKKNSPLEPTFVFALANGYNGYLPSAAQHESGGYETWRARSSYLEVQAADKIVERLQAMLAKVAAANDGG